MIGATLVFLRRHLDLCLTSDEPGDPQQDRVVFVAKATGESVQFTPNAVNLLLLNVEEDRASGAPELYAPWSDPSTVDGQPGPRLLLYILFVAPFADYATGWRQLSKILLHLHRERVIEGRPDLPPGVAKLICELVRLSLAEQNEIWGVLRTAYRSSLLYRVRLVPVPAGQGHDPMPRPALQAVPEVGAVAGQHGSSAPRPESPMIAVASAAALFKMPVPVAPPRTDSGA
jgi:hypothetical protein